MGVVAETIRSKLEAAFAPAELIILDESHQHAGHHRARGIGSMRGDGDQADVAMRLAPRFVVAANGQQARVFPLRTGVGLQRYRGEAGDIRQPFFQILEHLLIPARLFRRREWVHPAKLRPSHRKHLAGAVELHRA